MRSWRQAPTPPRELLMVGNSITPIHGRWWCVLEAFLAHQKQLDVHIDLLLDLLLELLR